MGVCIGIHLFILNRDKIENVENLSVVYFQGNYYIGYKFQIKSQEYRNSNISYVLPNLAQLKKVIKTLNLKLKWYNFTEKTY